MSTRIAKLIASIEDHSDHISWDLYNKYVKERVANITITGPCQIGKSIIYDKIVKMLKAEFPGIKLELTDPEEYDQLEDWQIDMVMKTKWIINEVTTATISEEGFFDFFKKNGKHLEIKDMDKWFNENVKTKKFTDFDISDKPVIILNKYAAAFFRNGKPIINISDGFKTDIDEYFKLTSKTLPVVLKYGEWLSKADSALYNFLNKYPGSNSEDKFIELVISIMDKRPVPAINNFSEPAYSFLGYTRGAFTQVKSYYSGGEKKKIFESDPQPTKEKRIELPPLNERTFNDIVAIIDIYNTMIDKLEELEMTVGWGLDMSDPPSRGYEKALDILAEKRIDDIYGLYHPSADEFNNYFIYNVRKRCVFLRDSLCLYLMLGLGL